MKLLFDQNLSPRLVARLADVFPGSEHVDTIGLGAAMDAEVWDYARANGYAVVTKVRTIVNSACYAARRRK